MTPHKENKLKLVRLFTKFNRVSSWIQNDIAKALLTDPKNRDHLAKQMKMSDHDQAVLLDQYTYNALEGMMLGTMNHCNMFGKTMAMHANLTGDPLMHDVFDEVNRQIVEEMEYN